MANARGCTVLPCQDRPSNEPNAAHQRLTWLLAADPLAGRHARRIIDEVNTRWRLTGLRDAAQVVATELVSNAVRHANAPIELRLTARPWGLRIEVSDGDASLPRPCPASEEHHGLRLVDALAVRWGIRPRRAGKTVWADLQLPAH